MQLLSKLHNAQEYIYAPLRNTSSNMQTYVLCPGRAYLSAYSKPGNWEAVFDYFGKEYTISIVLNYIELALAGKVWKGKKNSSPWSAINKLLAKYDL